MPSVIPNPNSSASTPPTINGEAPVTARRSGPMDPRASTLNSAPARPTPTAATNGITIDASSDARRSTGRPPATPPSVAPRATMSAGANAPAHPHASGNAPNMGKAGSGPSKASNGLTEVAAPSENPGPANHATDHAQATGKNTNCNTKSPSAPKKSSCIPWLSVMIST